MPNKDILTKEIANSLKQYEKCQASEKKTYKNMTYI